jgi:hypothetical protein
MKNEKNILAICGYAQAGKDTFGNAVWDLAIQKNVVKYKFAESLRDSLNCAFGNLGLKKDLWTEDFAEKTKLRPLLVEFGRYARAADQDIFARYVVEKIEHDFHAGVNLATITDLRYLNEDELLRSLAGARGWGYQRVWVIKEGAAPANAEEKASIHVLNSASPLDRSYVAVDGRPDTLERRAKDYMNDYIL